MATDETAFMAASVCYECQRSTSGRCWQHATVSLSAAKAKRGRAVYICGGDDRPGPRGTDCPDPLHDYPLPSGYVDASEMAAHRLYKRWKNVKCKACGLYGWVPPMGGSDV